MDIIIKAMERTLFITTDEELYAMYIARYIDENDLTNVPIVDEEKAVNDFQDWLRDTIFTEVIAEVRGA